MKIRNVSMKKAVFLALLAALTFSSAVAAGDSVVVRVPAQVRDQVDAASVQPAQVLDYGSFSWMEMKAADLDRLAGVPYVVVPDARQVRVPGYSFDPLVDGEPMIPLDRRASAARPGFRLVQLIGPPQDAWLRRLDEAGMRVLQYYPHNTYLVWNRREAGEAAGQLDFVRWQGLFHPAYKINSDLQGRTGRISNVDVMFYEDDSKGVLGALTGLGAEILQVYPSQPDKAFYDAIVRIDAGALDDVAALDDVLWLGYASPRPILDDEMSDQIVAGNHPGGTPVTGYQSHLSTLGVDGGGVIWAVVDTGVDYNHPDLSSRIVGGSSFPGIPGACDPGGLTPGNDCAGGGHGTHVAGILGGDATGGFSDANGFLYGLGVAPEYSIFAMNSLSGNSWPPAGGWQEHSKRAVLGGAIGGNNSWTTTEGTAHGYQASERTHDLMVRDGNFDTTAVAEPFIEVFSAGNSGPNPLTLTAPKEAKNLIVTASSRNFRSGSIDLLANSSSRGPAVDGRIVPTITAPGQQIASTRNDAGGDCATAIAGTSNLYAFCSGTSMASPHAAGAVVLITDWWRGLNAGANPSPAMAKALLVNGAVDMGTADIPNPDEGWGRVNITNVIAPAAPVEYWDQETFFGSTGEEFHQVAVGVPDPSLPVKVTLVWSDAPGAVGANPALVNNLDLTVVDGANTYLGNRFSAGTSVTGGTPDVLNNVENVFIQNHGSNVDITVAATAINGDGVPYNGDTTDQDFVLVCSNCIAALVFSDGFETGDTSRWSQ